MPVDRPKTIFQTSDEAGAVPGIRSHDRPEGQDGKATEGCIGNESGGVQNARQNCRREGVLHSGAVDVSLRSSASENRRECVTGLAAKDSQSSTPGTFAALCN